MGLLRKLLFLTIILCVLLSPSVAMAADQILCVRKGAGGTGSGADWTNACDELSDCEAKVSRTANDDVYIYVADGTYLGATIDAAVDGDDRIYIKKATATDHGTATGWDNSYGDGQAVFQWITRSNSVTHATALRIQTSYVTVDGGVLMGAASDDASYGFVVKAPADINTYSGGDTQGITAPDLAVTNLTISNVKITRVALIGAGYVTCLNATPYTCRNIGIASKSTNATAIEIANNYVRGYTVQIGVYKGSNYSIHDNYLESNTGGTGAHGEQIIIDGTTNVLLYNNILMRSMTAGLGGHATTGSSTNAKVYNNILVGQQGRTTITTSLTEPGTSIHVDNINGFQSYNALSSSLAVNGVNYTCNGATADEVNTSTTPYGQSGTLSFTANVSVANGASGNEVYVPLVTGLGSNDSGKTDVIVSSYFHHNTFVGIRFSSAISVQNLSDAATKKSYAYNNLFYNCISPRTDNATYTSGGIVHDYNAFLTCTGTITDEDNDQRDDSAPSTIFTNYAGGVYSIAAADQTAIDHIIGKGTTLASPFDTDRAGVSRTAPFDIGAYDVGGSADSTAPTLAEVTPVTTPSSNQAPQYVFSSDEAGTITYGGTCGNGSLSTAIVGNNTTAWNLGIGTYSNCTITVTDAASNASTPLAITEFVITPEVADAVKNISGGVVFQRIP